jgi:hypothetical protein
MRGRRVGSPSFFQSLRFQRLWNSFHAIWKAMKVLPVPVASVSRMRSRPSAMAPARARWRCPGSSGPGSAALVLEGHGGEAVAPGVLLWRRSRPEFFRRREGASSPSRRVHVDAVDALPVGGVGEAHRQLAGVVLGLRHAFGQRLVPGLGLDHRQLGVAVLQHVVGVSALPRLPWPSMRPGRDRVLAPDAAALDHAPARRLQGGVDVLGAGFGFVHPCLVHARLASASHAPPAIFAAKKDDVPSRPHRRAWRDDSSVLLRHRRAWAG